MTQLEISSPVYKREFNPFNERSELKAAISSAPKFKKEDKKPLWLKNAEKDLKVLEKDFKRLPILLKRYERGNIKI